ncbi:MAG: hypothetical protein WCY09_05100 [Candidatus Omnitrophota bacterium]
MGGGLELAKVEQMGNIYRLPCGIININIQGITLHLTQEAFMRFSLMVGNANSALMDNGLKELLEGDGN